MMNMDIKTIKTAYTHSGKFHADDVFSGALLRLLNPEIEFVRVGRVPEPTENAIVFDIGDGEFDHHQQNTPKRENGIPYASFGLLWKKFGTMLTDETNAEQIDYKFVAPLDSHDNGISFDTLSLAVSVMNPLWNETQDSDTAYEQAVQWASTILKRIITKANSETEAIQEVTLALKNAENGIVILSRYAPYEKVLVPSKAVFVIYPSLRGGYQISALPVELSSRVNKLSFPKEWCNANANDLPELTGITGFRFCHKNGFICSAETLTDAVKIARLTIQLSHRE